eukprot:1365902-Pleurochrysis_carterae.AAC.2
MRAQLLQSLAAPLSLPDALRTLGYLRRLGPPHAPPEPLLRLAFLRNRAIHFAQAIWPFLSPNSLGARAWLGAETGGVRVLGW